MSTASTNESVASGAQSTSLITIMTVAIGVIVANLYYLQPLLHQVTRDFRISETNAALLVILVQAGYAVGLAFVIPLGDLLARRRFAVAIFALATIVVVAGALVHSFVLFALITFLLGLASVGGQLIIPFGADMAPPALRGRVVARLMTGLLIGILLSRSVSGFIAQFASWRAVYWTASVALAAMAFVLNRVLPDEPARPRLYYGRLLAGTLGLFVSQPLLRRRAL